MFSRAGLMARCPLCAFPRLCPPPPGPPGPLVLMLLITLQTLASVEVARWDHLGPRPASSISKTI